MAKLRVEVGGGLSWWQHGNDEATRLEAGLHEIEENEHDSEYIRALKDAIAAQVGLVLLDDDDQLIPLRTDHKGRHVIAGRDVCANCLGFGPDVEGNNPLENDRLPEDGVCPHCGLEN
jgi:hypothetical protein